MPTEDSQGTQHHIPHGGTSQRRPSADANLPAELESLRASVTRMSEKYDHLHAKNVELEHDYRTLKRNWEMNQTQGSQRSPTQVPERTQPNQPEHPFTFPSPWNSTCYPRTQLLARNLQSLNPWNGGS
ncbi:unnamed protein product [Prunus armeniaca]